LAVEASLSKSSRVADNFFAGRMQPMGMHLRPPDLNTITTNSIFMPTTFSRLSSMKEWLNDKQTKIPFHTVISEMSLSGQSIGDNQMHIYHEKIRGRKQKGPYTRKIQNILLLPWKFIITWSCRSTSVEFPTCCHSADDMKGNELCRYLYFNYRMAGRQNNRQLLGYHY